MTLKGYEYFNDNGEVVMKFFLKDEVLCIYDNVSIEEVENFKKIIEDNGFEILDTRYYIEKDE